MLRPLVLGNNFIVFFFFIIYREFCVKYLVTVLLFQLPDSTCGRRTDGRGGLQCARTVSNMTEIDSNSSIKRKYNDLSLDLNLDQVTADEAWANYENIKLKYTLEVCNAWVCLGSCTCYLHPCLCLFVSTFAGLWEPSNFL